MKKLLLSILIILFASIPSYAFNVAIIGGSSPSAEEGCSAPIDEDDFNDGTLDAWDTSKNATNPGTTLLLTYAVSDDAHVRENDITGEPITEFSMQFSFEVNGAGTYSNSDYSPLTCEDATSLFVVRMRSEPDGSKIAGLRPMYIDDGGPENIALCGGEILEATTYYIGIYRVWSTGPGDNNGEMKVWLKTVAAEVGVGAAECSAVGIDDDEQTGVSKIELGGTHGDSFYDGSNTYTVTIDDYKLRTGEECFDL
jgi:hypothetical protein